jgi:tetratricopeptide (TPR) repeat protein
MNEETVQEIISHLQSGSTKNREILNVLEQSEQAITWAELSHNWDLLIDLVDALSSYYLSSSFPVSSISDLNLKQTHEAQREFWQQGKKYLMQGLEAAQKIGNQDKEIRFLDALTQIAILLQEFSAVLDFMTEHLRLRRSSTNSLTKSAFAYELNKVGQQAFQAKQFSASSALFQMSLELCQELNDKTAMASILFSLGQNELEQGKLRLAKDFFQRSIEVGDESTNPLQLSNSLWGLGEVLRQEGKLEQAKSSFEKALAIIDSIEISIVDGLEWPVVSPTRNKLQESLASLSP